MQTRTRYFVVNSQGKYLQAQQYAAPRVLAPSKFDWTTDREFATRFLFTQDAYTWLTYFFRHHPGVVIELTITEVPK